MIQDDKYLVEENDKGLGGGYLEPGDYFVLKRGDVLAISTLRSYANNAMTMLELDRSGHMSLDHEEKQYLLQLADYASELAVKWEQDPVGTLKLPD